MKEVFFSGTVIVLVWLIIFLIFLKSFFMVLKNDKRRQMIKKWAKSNGLNYRNKAKLPFVRLDSSVFLDVVSGHYNGKNVYFFDIFIGNKSQAFNCSFLNGKFYESEFLTAKKIENILMSEVLYPEKEVDRLCENIFSPTIHTQILVAQLFLEHSVNAKYLDVRRVFSYMLDKYGENNELNSKYNSPEMIAYLNMKLSGKIDDKIVQEVPNLYQEILDTCKLS